MTTELPEDEDLRSRLVNLQTEHRDLDQAIEVLVTAGGASPVQVQRLKKRKLMLKDAIVQLQNRLIPDIIA